MAARKKQIKNILKRYPLAKFILFFVSIFIGFILGVKREYLSFGGDQTSAVRLGKNDVISSRELKKLFESQPADAGVSQEDSLTMINVHTPYEGEIAGTDTFIEYDSITASEARLPKDKNASIVLYCKSGNMSEQALKTLKGMGYKNVKHLDGGMDAWKKDGNELLDLSGLPGQVLPESGFELPISWGDIAPRLVELGVIDKEKFEKAVGMGEEEKMVFEGKKDQPIKINAQNSQFVV